MQYLENMDEDLREVVDLDIEEQNELQFKVKVEGIASGPAKVRLVCESRDMSYMFNARATDDPDVVSFIVPKMMNKLAEGEYNARVEVLVENRYFSPVQFNINFKKALRVVVESVVKTPQKKDPEVRVSAVPVVVKQKKTVVEEKSKSISERLKEIDNNMRLSTEQTEASNSLRDKYAKKLNKK